jgi:hypothetical protein
LNFALFLQFHSTIIATFPCLHCHIVFKNHNISNISIVTFLLFLQHVQQLIHLNITTPQQVSNNFAPNQVFQQHKCLEMFSVPRNVLAYIRNKKYVKV